VWTYDKKYTDDGIILGALKTKVLLKRTKTGRRDVIAVKIVEDVLDVLLACRTVS
jgi:hypothetical protein